MLRRGSERFCDLSAKRGVNSPKPIPRIRNLRAVSQIIRDLIANQIGVNYEKRRREKRLAHLVVAAEKVLRQQ